MSRWSPKDEVRIDAHLDDVLYWTLSREGTIVIADALASIVPGNTFETSVLDGLRRRIRGPHSRLASPHDSTAGPLVVAEAQFVLLAAETEVAYLQEHLLRRHSRAQRAEHQRHMALLDSAAAQLRLHLGTVALPQDHPPLA
jgi:hypothetical protein